MVKRKNARAAALGLLADRLIAHPRVVPHPLVAFGTFMNRFERRIYADEVRAGAVYAGVGIGAAAASSAAIRSTALATWVSTGGRQLHEVALEIADCLQRHDLEAARELLPSLVGRDPAALDSTGMARAVIESVAENTVDAIVAPAFWAAMGGAPGVLIHRAVDTLDSMVGYRNERYARFGTASARLDDALAWIPARITVALVAVARPGEIRGLVRALRHEAGRHPSPNAGPVEAAFAIALGVQLGGPAAYPDRVEQRPYLGSGRAPGPADIAAAVALSSEISTALVAGLVGVGLTGRRK